VVIGLDRHFHLGADAIGGGDQDRVGEAGRLEVEQRAETAEIDLGAGAGGGLGLRLDRFDQRGAGIDVNARIFVRDGGDGVLAGVRPRILSWTNPRLFRQWPYRLRSEVDTRLSGPSCVRRRTVLQ
jgi:hypothetical protein